MISTYPKLEIQDWHDMLDYVALHVVGGTYCEILGTPILQRMDTADIWFDRFDIDRVVTLDDHGYAVSVKPWSEIPEAERNQWTNIVGTLLYDATDVTDDWCESQIGRVA